MKRLIIFLFALGMMPGSKAQEWEVRYDPIMHSGLTTSPGLTGDGHLMAGIYSSDLAVVKTDANGNFTGTAFNNYYTLRRNNSPATITHAEAIEFSDGSGFGVMGSYNSLFGDGLFYVYLTPAGAVTAIQGYNFSGLYSRNPRFKSLCESITTPGDVFGAGDFGSNEIFYLRVSQTGNLIWGWSYHTWQGQLLEVSDIIQAPYDTNNVIIVGKTWDIDHTGQPNWNGAWIEVDDNTGVAYTRTYYNWGSGGDEEFTSINISSNGFVLGGKVRGNRAWVTELAPNRVPNWSYEYPNPRAPANGNMIEDIVERTGFQQYYVIGQSFDNNHMFMLEISTVDGYVFGGVEYLGNNDGRFPVNINLNTAGFSPGVALYSNIQNANRMDIIKADFNGVYPCDWDPYFPDPEPIDLNWYYHGSVGYEMDEVTLTNDDPEDLSHTRLCDPVLPGAPGESRGHKADKTIAHAMKPVKQVPVQRNRGKEAVPAIYANEPLIMDFRQKGQGPGAGNRGADLVVKSKISPNPVGNDKILQVDLYAYQDEQVEISIMDILGRSVYSEIRQNHKGSNRVSIQLDPERFKTGVYNLVIRRGAARETHKVSVN